MVKDEEKLLAVRNEQVQDCLDEKKHLLEKYENAKKRIQELEKEIEELKKSEN